MSGKNWFKWSDHKTAAAGSNDVTFGPVEAGRAYHLLLATAEDETSAPTDVRAIIDAGGVEYVVGETNTPGSATLVKFDDDFHLSEGDKLILRVSGATANDRLSAYLFGYWYEVPQGP